MPVIGSNVVIETFYGCRLWREAFSATGPGRTLKQIYKTSSVHHGHIVN